MDANQLLFSRMLEAMMDTPLRLVAVGHISPDHDEIVAAPDFADTWRDTRRYPLTDAEITEMADDLADHNDNVDWLRHGC